MVGRGCAQTRGSRRAPSTSWRRSGSSTAGFGATRALRRRSFWEGWADQRRLAPITGAGLKEAGTRFKRRTSNVEGWYPRVFGNLSISACDGLALILNTVEDTGQWPRDVSLLQMVLPLKPDASGRRSIGLYGGSRGSGAWPASLTSSIGSERARRGHTGELPLVAELWTQCGALTFANSRPIGKGDTSTSGSIIIW